MSWHTSGFLIQSDCHTRPEWLFSQLGLGSPKLIDKCSFEEATSFNSIGWAIGRVAGWTVVWDSLMFLDLEELQPSSSQSLWPAHVDAGLARLSVDSQVFSILLEGTSSTFGFMLHRGGTCIRCYLKQSDTIQINFGKLLSEEVSIFSIQADAETQFLSLLERVTVPINHLIESEYDVYCRYFRKN